MSAPLNQTSRDLVFCHHCENEWYRDEHGLECPDCHSDVVEIIEAEHDPRQEMHQDESGAGNPLLAFLNQSALGGDSTHNEPSTERGGPGQPIVTHEERDTPDGHHIRRTVHFSSTGGNPFAAGPRQSPGSPGDQTVQNLFSSLFSQVGNMTPEQAMGRASVPPNPGPFSTQAPPTQHPGPDDPSSPRTYDRGPPAEPYARGPPPVPDGGPQVRHQQYRWGPFNVSMTTSSNTFVNGQQVGHQVGPGDMHGGMQRGMGVPPDEDMDGILQRAFEPFRSNMRPGSGTGFILSTGDGGSRGQEGLTGLAGPLAMILSSLGMAGQGGRMGDLVFSDEAMDQIVSRLMEQNQQGNAPGPAAREAINSLPRIKVSKEMLDEATGEADCAICLVNVEEGEEVAQLPCKHWFHFGCVEAWLTEHDTCPQCRRGITPREGDSNRPRETGEAPRHWQAQSPSLTRSNTMDDERGGSSTAPGTSGSDSHAYGASREPTSRRRSRSPHRDSSGGSASGPAQSIRESVTAGVRNAVRNGILGWMGRPRSGDGTNDSGEASGPQSARGQDTSSSSGPGSVPGHSTSSFTRCTGGDNSSHTTNTANTQRRGPEHEGLDVPDVD